ncbi:hypothetical protein BDK51DRAFT_34617 [Blyttiomyces helicus]|uniref:Uncharacterized protein n=1 Tax=Blyttiomyces helicus TaxID=388810 RepID=A0A4P9W6B7_9FUNG|nr:hypothetical protein BDK51DRAFT_34617 [Blyttiomyces helicus]|eukprot:RKO86903.1 hypothetical protein BDK51DRAFT_34617 [Blyttiomyces helicus]
MNLADIDALLNSKDEPLFKFTPSLQSIYDATKRIEELQAEVEELQRTVRIERGRARQLGGALRVALEEVARVERGESGDGEQKEGQEKREGGKGKRVGFGEEIKATTQTYDKEAPPRELKNPPGDDPPLGTVAGEDGYDDVESWTSFTALSITSSDPPALATGWPEFKLPHIAAPTTTLSPVQNRPAPPFKLKMTFPSSSTPHSAPVRLPFATNTTPFSPDWLASFATASGSPALKESRTGAGGSILPNTTTMTTTSSPTPFIRMGTSTAAGFSMSPLAVDNQPPPIGTVSAAGFYFPRTPAASIPNLDAVGAAATEVGKAAVAEVPQQLAAIGTGSFCFGRGPTACDSIGRAGAVEVAVRESGKGDGEDVAVVEP